VIVVNITGGLGNQMFQYAFAYAVSKRSDVDEVKLSTESYLNDTFRKYELDKYAITLKLANIDEVKKIKYQKENIYQKVIRKLTRKKRELSQLCYVEPHFHFDYNVLKSINKKYFEGYWQSEKYFKEYRNDLLNQFKLINPIHSKSEYYKKLILSSSAISLHIRRGDYVSVDKNLQIHGVCSLDYYSKAVKKIEEAIKKPLYFIFSDDLEWAKQNLEFIKNKKFVELDKSIHDHEEIYLMSLCKHNIIANSTFSWWGAWLNQNENKITIAPKKWFNDPSKDTKDIIPKEWICI
jgi:hypothetical protein